MAGGLATTCTVVRADFWRLGQCRPGDTIHFKRISWKSALLLRQRTEAYLAEVEASGGNASPIRLIDVNLPDDWDETILHRIPASSSTVEVVFRQAGDSYIHVTYGPMTSNALTRAHIQHRLNRVKQMPEVLAVIGATRCELFTPTTRVVTDIQPTALNSMLSKPLKLPSFNA